MFFNLRLKNKIIYKLLSKFGIFEYPIKNLRYEKFMKKYMDKFNLTSCPCGSKDEIYYSLYDRYGQYFPTILCKICGLLRSMYSLNNLDEKEFYEKYYRDILFNKEKIDYKHLEITEENKYKKICEKINKIIDLNGEEVLVIGGGVGGILKNFKDSKKILTEYDPACINYSKENFQDIRVIHGSLGEVAKLGIKPKLIIFTHVIEHWISLNEEFRNLKEICTPNETFVFIETPGLDSNKNGRRRFDFIGDIFYGHKYYFSSYVLNNYFKRNNFDCIFSNSTIQALYHYKLSDQIKEFEIINYKKVLEDLKLTNKKLIFYRLSIIRILKISALYLKKIIKFFLINFKLLLNR